MKNVIAFLGFALIISFNGCVKEDTGGPGFELVGIKSGNQPLNVGFVTGVSTMDNITVTFSSDIDYSSLTDTTVTLKRDTVHLAMNYIVSGRTLTIDPVKDLLSGAKLILRINGEIKSTKGQAFAGLVVYIQTAGVGVDTPPRSEEQVLYVQFNGSITDVTRINIVKTASLTYTVDRFGTANEAGNFVAATAPGSGNIVEFSGPSLIPANMTMSIWFNIANLSYRSPTTTKPMFGLAADRGYYFEIGADDTTGPDAFSFSTDHLLSPPDNTTNYKSVIDTYNGSAATNDSMVYAVPRIIYQILSDGWHHLGLTYDASTSLKTAYIDGVKIVQWFVKPTKSGSSLTDLALNATDSVGLGLHPELALGYYCSRANIASKNFSYTGATNTFVGFLDDLRIFKVAFTQDEMLTLYNGEKPLK